MGVGAQVLFFLYFFSGLWQLTLHALFSSRAKSSSELNTILHNTIAFKNCLRIFILRSFFMNLSFTSYYECMIDRPFHNSCCISCVEFFFDWLPFFTHSK